MVAIRDDERTHAFWPALLASVVLGFALLQHRLPFRERRGAAPEHFWSILLRREQTRRRPTDPLRAGGEQEEMDAALGESRHGGPRDALPLQDVRGSRRASPPGSSMR